MITKIKNIYHICLLFARQNHNMNICNQLLVLFCIKIRYVKTVSTYGNNCFYTEKQLFP